MLVPSRLKRLVDGLYNLLAKSSASGSRSTALAPMHWLLVIVLGAFLTSIKLGASPGIVQMLGLLCVIGFAVECFAFVFLLFKDRDALRSERFTIEKLRIEKGILGDTLSGFKEIGAGEVIETKAISGNRTPNQ